MPYSYTSGYIESKEAFNTQYGYIEAQIQLPHDYGFWPAFWTFVGSGLPSNSNAAEIDIFEMTGSDAKAPHIVGTNIHKDYCDCDNYTCDGCDYMFEPICPDYNSSIL